MQMYRVKIVLHDRSGPSFVEGLVCAGNAEAAGNMVAQIIEWPLSRCSFVVERVKPSYYELSRRKSANALSDGLTAQADYIGQPATWWTVAATMKVRSRTESGAVKGAARALEADAKSNEPAGNIRDLEITCEPVDIEPRSPAIEKQSIFSHVQFFQGGSARGK